MNALSGETQLFAEVDGKYGVYTLRELYKLHKQGCAIKIPALLNEKGEKTWVEVEDAVSYGKLSLKRITLATTRLYTELTEDAIIPAYSPNLFSGTEEQINLKLKPVNELKVTQETSDNDTLLLTTRIPLNIPEGEQTDWEIGFALGYFIAEGSLVYRKYKNTKRSLATLNGLARKNGMSLQEYLNYTTDIRCVVLSIGQLDFERGYVDIVQKNFKFGNLSKIKHENGFNLFSFDLDFIRLIKDYTEGNVSRTKRLKNEVYNRSWNFLEGVLAGFLSGDGYHDKKGDRFRVEITTNYRLYNDLIFLSKALGYDTHINKGRFKKNSFHPSNNYYYLILSIFKNWHRLTAVGLVKEHIKKIEDVGEKEAFNLVLKPLYSENDKRAKFNHLYFIAYGIMVSDAVKSFDKPLLPKPRVLLK